ncbi:MAG: dUTP diphosphatase [Alphaproteobacteria bacterium]|nr:dUTP diphosphatase [Alphaproteobacteria bacterium]
MSEIPVSIRQLPNGEGLPLPAYATAQSSGLDLAAALDEDIVIGPGEHAVVPTGVAIALPDGFEAQVRPRSGLAAKHAVTVLNSPGTIDTDYRGEIRVVLANHGTASFTVSRGMRIAQLVIAPVSRIIWNEVDALTDSPRGDGGFGSTGPDGGA